MSTFTEALHPRAADGTFTEKPHSSAEVSLPRPEDAEALLARVVDDRSLLDSPLWDTLTLPAFEAFNTAAAEAGHPSVRQSLIFVFEGDDREGMVVDAFDQHEARDTAARAFADHYGEDYDPDILELVGAFRDDGAAYSDEARFIEGSGDARRARRILEDS